MVISDSRGRTGFEVSLTSECGLALVLLIVPLPLVHRSVKGTIEAMRKLARQNVRRCYQVHRVILSIALMG